MASLRRVRQFFAKSKKQKTETLISNNQIQNGSVGPSDRLEWEVEQGSTDPVFRNLKWIVVKDASTCDRVISFLESKMDGKLVVGLDIEYDPCFQKGQRSRTALLQLGIHTGHCVLIQVCKVNHLSPGLVKLLINPRIIKVGVGIQDDVIKINRDFGLRVQGLFDLRQIAPPAQKMGLAALTQDHLNTKLPKSKTIIMSKWSKELSPQKRAYAAKDAYVAVLLIYKLVAKTLKVPESTVNQNDILSVKKESEKKT